ncbi:unnamed protein product [Cuscuta campestris]|uniref:Adenylyl-sulfate kinase n=1 Tax=Cuscuta campestris TaxID=132261 RepID=A0A484NF31_9ASTE|nr:unnamed protein product [Cuscuta campestris]
MLVSIRSKPFPQAPLSPDFYSLLSNSGKRVAGRVPARFSGANRGFSPCIFGGEFKSNFMSPIRALEASSDDCNDISGKDKLKTRTLGNSSNIFWHKCSVEKSDREKLLQQKGCVVWITGLSGSGKSTVACALSRGLHARGKLTYILDGDNVRHGLNRDLSFGAKDRTENIRRVGEVAKLFSDAGVICIVSLVSPYRKERDFCRSLLLEGDFIEVFMEVPLHVCEARDPKGLYKLARAGFTGIDDPYEPPMTPEIVLHVDQGCNDSPSAMAEIVVSYLEKKGYLEP